METTAAKLKKGQTFKIKGKRKKYSIEDVFHNYLSLSIYYRIRPGKFGNIKIQKDQIVEVF